MDCDALVSSANQDFNSLAPPLDLHECKWSKTLVHALTFPKYLPSLWYSENQCGFLVQNCKVLVALKVFENKAASPFKVVLSETFLVDCHCQVRDV